MAIVLPTNADTDLYAFGTNALGTTLTFEVSDGHPHFYFDASDAGPTDATGNWNNDANAFDGSASTAADQVQSGGTPFKATGTNAPGSGDTILGVDFAFLASTDSSIPEGEDWNVLSVPSGGWTWTKVQALHVEISGLSDRVEVYESDGGTSLGYSIGAFSYLYRIDVRVRTTTGLSDTHLLILATGDDEDIVWTAPTNFTELVEFNDLGGDDASVGAWVALASNINSNSINLVRSGSEELVGVMMVVQGADITNFDDTVAPTTASQQNSNGPTNAAITTITDNAVVIVATGNRTDAGHLNITGSAWDTSPPSGYTAESNATAAATNAAGAPGRLEQGTGAGDAQMSWAHKTVTTAGTETPGAWAGFTSTRDHKCVTFVIKPGGPTAYTKTVTDPVGVTDATTRIVPFVRTVNESVGVTDTTLEAKAVIDTVTDAVGVIDDVSYTLSHTMSLSVTASGDDGYGFPTGSFFNNTGLTAFFGDDGDASHAFFRFALTADLVGATINAATITGTVDGNANTIDVDIYADDSDDPAAPTTWAQLDGITPTTASVNWTLDTSSGSLTSPDFSAVIQEIVDSYGPLDTEHITIIFDPDAYSATGIKEMHTQDDADAAVLYIEYTTSTSVDPLRPVSDNSAAGWDTAPTASQALWSQLDEETPSDTDYIFAEDA